MEKQMKSIDRLIGDLDKLREFFGESWFGEEIARQQAKRAALASTIGRSKAKPGKK